MGPSVSSGRHSGSTFVLSEWQRILRILHILHILHKLYILHILHILHVLHILHMLHILHIVHVLHISHVLHILYIILMASLSKYHWYLEFQLREYFSQSKKRKKTSQIPIMASLRKYTCTCEVTLTPGLFLVNICNICIKIHQNCTKNLVLEPLWGALGAILEFPGNQDAPKRRQRAPKRRQDRNFWGNLTQLGSNLEAETLPNRG